MNAALLVAGLLGPYLWAAHRARRGWPPARTLAAVSGVLVLAGSVSGPLGAAADRTLATHMVQHLVVSTVAPLLVALGAPIRLVLAVLPPSQARAIVRALRRVPWVVPFAVLLPAAVMLLVHLTGVFDLALQHPWLHVLEHAALFWTALAGWIVVLGVDPVPSPPGAVGIFAATSAWMIAGAAVGAAYSDRGDRLAGSVMWVGGALVLVPLTLGLCMRALLAEERRQQRREAAAR